MLPGPKHDARDRKYYAHGPTKRQRNASQTASWEKKATRKFTVKADQEEGRKNWYRNAEIKASVDYDEDAVRSVFLSLL
jgi:hypothetical protein